MTLYNSNGNYTMESIKDGSIWEGEITWDQWVEKYKPIKNHLDKYSHPDTPYGMFETFGAEVDYVKEQDPNKIWTLVDGDCSSLMLAGWHFVNRIGYYITEVPWTDERETVLVSVEVECECFDQDKYDEGDDAGDPNCQLCEGYGLRTEWL